MKTWKIIGLVLIGLVLLITLDFSFGYIGVFKTKTVEKAQQSAEREVFKQTRSFTESKAQDLIRYRQEYLSEKDESSKAILKSTIQMMYADFDEDWACDEKIITVTLRDFLKEIKYN